MALIDDATRTQLRERLSGSLVGAVELRLYRRPAGVGCATCDVTEELMRELADAAPEQISLTVVDMSDSSDPSIEVPTVTVSAPGMDPRITFQGLPAGYEFATLIDAIERVSLGTGDLAPELADMLAGLDQEVEVMVFVTPTCPYCPRGSVDGKPHGACLVQGAFACRRGQ